TATCWRSARARCACGCARRCRWPRTTASAWSASCARRCGASRCWRRRSSPTCWAASWCRWATFCTTPASAAGWTPSGTNWWRGAAMRFKPDEIVSVLRREIEGSEDKLKVHEVGRVLEVGDGIARVYGLGGVMAGEMVEFTRTKVRGVAFNLEENSVG